MKNISCEKFTIEGKDTCFKSEVSCGNGRIIQNYFELFVNLTRKNKNYCIIHYIIVFHWPSEKL